MREMKFVGSKCEATRNLDVAAIAKRVRREIKDAVAAGELPKGLKTSVRISRYSMGQSLDVWIMNMGEGGLSVNPAHVKWHLDNPHAYPGPAPARNTAEADRVIGTIEGMVNAYNFDDSDSQVDYFHVRFYGDVSIDHAIENADRKAICAVGEDHGYPDLSTAAAEAKDEAQRAIDTARTEVLANGASATGIRAVQAAEKAVAKVVPKRLKLSDVPAIPVFYLPETPTC